MPVLLRPGESVVATLNPESEPGKSAPVDGVPTWRSSNEAAATVDAATDGMTCTVTYVGDGTADIDVVADADLTAAVRDLTTVDTVTCHPAEAQTLRITWGTPTT